MTTANEPLSALPAATRVRLEQLAAALNRTLGDALVGLLVFGSAVRGGYREATSDVDVVLVLRDAPRERLDAIANLLQEARAAARIEAIILTEDEIPRAADVFPLLYDDIRQCHVVLAGRDPFSGLVISDVHRRLRIEQELREAQIRLRRAVVDGGGLPAPLAAAVRRKAKQVRGPLHALIVLRGTRCADTLDAVLAAAGEAYGVDVAPLARAGEAPAEAHAALTRLLTAAIDDVDRRDEASVSGAVAGSSAAAGGA